MAGVQLVHDVLVGLTSLLTPPHCLLCRTPLASDAGELVCGGCWTALPANDPPWCRACGVSLTGLGRDVTICAACRTTRTALAWARAACRYDGTAKQCVVGLKYHRHLGLAEPMARRMAAAASEPPGFSAEALVPIPLHPVRAREREFNQAGVLAQALSQPLGLLVLEGVLGRRRATAPQTSLDAAGRRRNVARAFAVTDPARVRGRALLLVDDVLTTGATARACATALRTAGATQVGVLVFAHG